jgi:hypothetical protein
MSKDMRSIRRRLEVIAMGVLAGAQVNLCLLFCFDLVGQFKYCCAVPLWL